MRADMTSSIMPQEAFVNTFCWGVRSVIRKGIYFSLTFPFQYKKEIDHPYKFGKGLYNCRKAIHGSISRKLALDVPSKRVIPFGPWQFEVSVVDIFVSEIK